MRNRIEILFSFLLLFVLFPKISQSQTEHNNLSLDQRLHIGEEFTYLAKYAFINLGEIKIKVYAKDTYEGKTIYKSIAYIDSYKGLPFVTLHQIYESWFDSTLHPIYFQAHIFNENDTSYTKYYFQQNNKVHVLRGKLNRANPSMDTVIILNGKYQDGFSLLFFARFNPGGSNSTIVPCFINEDTASTFINYFYNENEISVDAVEYEIECFKLDGETNFIGIFGLTGYFEGWFSNDEYRIPISANLQVILGSISIELMDWNKNKWKPPVYKE